MPFIDVYTNTHIGDKKEEIKKKLGQAICVIPTKNESQLMVRLSEDQVMYMAGKDQPAAMVILYVKDHFEQKYYEAFNKELTAILQEELGIDPGCIYLKMDENDIWGVRGIIV